MDTETTQEGIPVYPNATEVDYRTVSLADGGGVDSTYTSDDPFEKVVGFYEHRLGPGDKDALPGKRRARTSIYIGRRDWLKQTDVESGPEPMSKEST